MKGKLNTIRRIHLVGIGGVGMTALALLLKDRGFTVSGSDIKESRNTKMLKEKSFPVYIGHRRENIQDAQLLCYSSAVKEDNIEILEAIKRGIEVVKRAELLSWISWNDKNIVISGSHGKTTTSALTAFVLTSLGYNPNVFVGGVALDFGKSAWSGKDLFVIEADESDGSFLCYNSWISVVTNIDYEHLDYYKNFDNLLDSFHEFIINAKSLAIGCGDDSNVVSLMRKVPSCLYGLRKHNDVRGKNIRLFRDLTVFDFYFKDRKFSEIELSLVGEHNVLNALAALAICGHLGVDIDKIIPLLKKFKGTYRRFQLKANIGGVIFVDDYAHHPKEIEVTLKAAKQFFKRRLVVVFQPHRYSRIKLLYKKFAQCFYSCDYLVVTDIYAAGEPYQDNISGVFLANEIRNSFKNTVYIPKEELSKKVPLLLQEGDAVIGLGAGDINIVMESIVREFLLKEKYNIKV